MLLYLYWPQMLGVLTCQHAGKDTYETYVRRLRFWLLDCGMGIFYLDLPTLYSDVNGQEVLETWKRPESCGIKLHRC